MFLQPAHHQLLSFTYRIDRIPDISVGDMHYLLRPKGEREREYMWFFVYFPKRALCRAVWHGQRFPWAYSLMSHRPARSPNRTGCDWAGVHGSFRSRYLTRHNLILSLYWLVNVASTTVSTCVEHLWARAQQFRLYMHGNITKSIELFIPFFKRKKNTPAISQLTGSTVSRPMYLVRLYLLDARA